MIEPEKHNTTPPDKYEENENWFLSPFILILISASFAASSLGNGTIFKCPSNFAKWLIIAIKNEAHTVPFPDRMNNQLQTVGSTITEQVQRGLAPPYDSGVPVVATWMADRDIRKPFESDV